MNLLIQDTRVMKIDGTLIYHDKGPSPRFVFDPTAIMGWSDGVGVRRDSSERPVGAGDFAEQGRLASRLVTVTGHAVARDVNELHEMRDQFVGLLADGGYQWISLTTGQATRYMLAGLGGATGWIQQGDLAASWRLDLYMPDPRQYGEPKTGQLYSSQEQTNQLLYPLSYPLTFSNTPINVSTTLQNIGNVKSWPTFVIDGDYPTGFTLRDPETGRSVVYRGMVSSSAPVTIDFAAGTATMNGKDRSYDLAEREWFAIPARGELRPRFIPNMQANSGYCNVHWRDTWI